ncbi:hypothetical protein RND81_11G026800 [Saponaria officinalis]|uniref:Protein WVD2-like 7 n=1 Tax=Saponaria officinalis TaxID=3572 RepID=A0AAW1HIU7_SAPOF
MGESMLETPKKVENNMGESVTNVPYLQQSVSFGRFERDSLCWERWSTFPTNKYLEEVEKCSTPGSVAQKKAYFEAHYKKIAARRAELLLDQEREREAELVNENPVVMSLSFRTSEEDLDDEKADTDNFVGETDQREMSSDGEGRSIEDVRMNGNFSDMFVQENEVDSFDADVSDEHDGFNHENDNGAFIVIDVSEQSNVVSKKCEDVDEIKDGDDVVDEASEVVKSEVTENIHELTDGAVVIDEVVTSEVNEYFDKPDDRADAVKGDDKQPQEEFAKADLCFTSKNPELVKLKAPASVIGDVPSIQESKGEELPQEKVKRTIIEEQSGNLKKLATSKKTEKAALAKKTNSTRNTQKRLASAVPTRTTASIPKSPMLSTLKSSKPEPTKVAKSASRLFDKKEHGFTPPSIKKMIGPQSKRVFPTSLHMSISYGRTNQDPASDTMRKSLIMERMGDKDIVKRAFKAFQNPPQTISPSLAKSPAIKQSASRKVEQKGSPANTLPKKNEGIERAAKTGSTRTGLQGTRRTLVSPGVNKNAGADQRNVKSVAASFGPRVQLQGSNQKELLACKNPKARTNVV